ncbi:hypothetical protein B0H14DRAFT_2568282 [Mycena olivaceomarginata]|nr:hypothetical protein B0H14DRAFT_2568282 [Mycena olivaceomarginata]
MTGLADRGATSRGCTKVMGEGPQDAHGPEGGRDNAEGGADETTDTGRQVWVLGMFRRLPQPQSDAHDGRDICNVPEQSITASFGEFGNGSLALTRTRVGENTIWDFSLRSPILFAQGCQGPLREGEWVPLLVSYHEVRVRRLAISSRRSTVISRVARLWCSFGLPAIGPYPFLAPQDPHHCSLKLRIWPARWCAGGHPSSNRSWVGESTAGRTTLDGILAVSTMVWNGVVIVMLSNDQEDRENTGRRQACAIASQVVIYLVLEQVLGWQEHLWEVGRVGRMGYSYCPTRQRDNTEGGAVAARGSWEALEGPGINFLPSKKGIVARRHSGHPGIRACCASPNSHDNGPQARLAAPLGPGGCWKGVAVQGRAGG